VTTPEARRVLESATRARDTRERAQAAATKAALDADATRAESVIEAQQEQR